MRRAPNFFLAAHIAAFLFLVIACVMKPGLLPFACLAAVAFCLTTVIAVNLDTAYIFSLLATLGGIGILLAFRDTKIMALTGGCLALLWILMAWVSYFEKKKSRWELALNLKTAQAQKTLDERAAELSRYQTRFDRLKEQSELRTKLAQGVALIGKSFNAIHIERALEEAVMLNFPEGQITVAWFDSRGEEALDPFEMWVKDRRNSLAVSDISGDSRFKSYYESGPADSPSGSVLIAPLVQGAARERWGFVKISSLRPNAFSHDDLRVLDLYALLANLAFENAALHAQVQELAIHDPLTGVFTRRIFDDKLNEECARASRYHLPLSLALTDIDHFKNFNDHYGHQVGDALLKWLTGIFKTMVREVDFVARYGGEEFVLVMPETPRERAAEIAEFIRQTVAGRDFAAAGQTLKVTISVGVASYPDETTSPAQLIRAADERLYLAKGSGRNRVISY